MTRNWSRQKEGLIIREEILAANLGFLKQLLTIAEACTDSRPGVLALMARFRYPIQQLNQEFTDRTPASVTPDPLAADMSEINKRYALLKDRWIVQDSEISESIAELYDLETL